MNNVEIFEQFLTHSVTKVPVLEFFISLILTFILSSLLSYVYIRYGHSLSNRKAFSNNFHLLSMTTMLIITIVKSSLALSLGLVGALSIVRFRTALKEPEELTFTFLAISIGLGLGANQLVITLMGVGIILGIIVLKRKFSDVKPTNYLHLVISSQKPDEIDYRQVIEVLSKYCKVINLVRLSHDSSHLESAINIDIDNYSQLMNIKDEISDKFPSLALNFVDNSGILTT